MILFSLLTFYVDILYVFTLLRRKRSVTVWRPSVG